MNSKVELHCMCRMLIFKIGSFFDKGRKEPIDYNNFLPRGSTLRNTEFVYGLVVFTG